jgi:hypothetical protein
VRVLATTQAQKTDRNDAVSIVIAALRAPDVRSVQRADHAVVLRLLAKRIGIWAGPGTGARAGFMPC